MKPPRIRNWGLAVLISISAALPAAAQTNNFFPLMAWGSADAAAFKKMRDCGITVAGFVAAKDLDLCHAAGLKAILYDPRASGYDWKNVDETVARKKIAALVADTASHPALYGYYLIDEPNAGLFPGLAKVSSLIRELAPAQWAYINLFPNYASPAQLGTATYDEYLDQFASICQPTALSYDHYAMMEGGTLRNGYWQNLASMRAAAKKCGRPFWNIVLSVAHFNYREPSAADLRFQVYTTLAFGGRGIAYFTYFAPQVGNYRLAPIDQFGNTTATWYQLQNVNLQVAKLAPTLLQLSSDAVYHFGAVPPGLPGPTETNLVQTLSGSFLAGDFTHADGSRYVMIVNPDFVNSRHCNPQFLGSHRGVQMVSPYTGQLTDFSGEQMWLAPGQGVLLKLL